MPGVFNLSVDEAVKEAQQAHSLGVPAVILFGLPERKMNWLRAPGQTMESCSKRLALSNAKFPS